MAGNSQRRGATRKPGTKKGQVVGSGGQPRQKLEGRGPTPKAEERPGHTAYRRARSAEKHASKGSGGRGSKPGPGRSGKKPANESVAGRNSVLEALQAGVAPPVLLRATDESALEVVRLEDLMAHAADVAS